MLELLAPAGSPEAVLAAVQSGADAIYLGYGDFNARRNAKNFSREEFEAAVSYCHLRGCKVYLTLNTLLRDRELPAAAEVVRHASEVGVDAILVQDMGVLRMLRQVAPDVPVHGSTQLTVHNLDGVLRCADLGMTRVVLSRELSMEAIEHICLRSPIEIEVFGHGALCMCYSGQCFFSSVIGGRSGNRGLCAQPCRMKYGWMDRPDSYPLSLKDMSLAGHLEQLRKIGVKCLKLEGRMKRPEYVSVVTRIYAQAIKEGREPTPDEINQLAEAFSRQGFTDGYWRGETGPDMFGIREEGKEPKELFEQARSLYKSGEQPRVPITFYALAQKDRPLQVAVEDPSGRVIRTQGPVPEMAVNKPLTAEIVENQLSRTGGTPYYAQAVKAVVEPELALPLSTLNALRREVLEKLSQERALPPDRMVGEYHPGVRYDNRREDPVYTVSLRRADQVSPALLNLKPAIIYLPVEEIHDHPDYARRVMDAGIELVAALPRIVWDREMETLKEQLSTARRVGVSTVLVGTLNQLETARAQGFEVRGDYGLGVYNSQSLKEYKRMGLRSATVSFELKFPQIRDISKSLDVEAIVYGRLPLMITENCIIKNRTGRCACQNQNQLVDRTGARFPVVKAPGCRNEILNSKKLFLADKAADYARIGLWAARLQFTTENAMECAQVLERYLGRGPYEPNDYTRGLYYRDVE